MKKFSLMLTLAIMMVGSTVFAGSIDYLSNQSAKYIMNTARTAATDGADIVAYNPAGTALMGEGFFLDVSSQTLLKYYDQDAEYKTGSFSESYSQDTPTLVLPNIYAVYNAGQIGVGKLAGYAQAGIVAGGGSLEWDGTAGIMAAGYDVVKTVTTAVGGGTNLKSTDVEVNGSSIYYTIGGGVSYSFLEDMLSLSAGVKYVMAKRTAEVTGALNFQSAGTALAGLNTTWALDIKEEYDYDAEGLTYVLGFDAKPVKELTIGLRFETETDLEFEYDESKNSVTSTNATANAAVAPGVATKLKMDGKKANQNLSQILSIGAEYVVMPELSVSVSSNIYFIGDADMNGYEDNFGTGYEVGCGAVYKVMEPLKVGGTFMYTSQGAKDELYTTDTNLLTVSSNPVLDSLMFGLGATYTIIPNLDITLAANWVHYLPVDETTDAGFDVSYEKEVYTIALGVGYKI